MLIRIEVYGKGFGNAVEQWRTVYFCNTPATALQWAKHYRKIGKPVRYVRMS